MLKTKINKIYKSNYFPFFVLAFLMLILHLTFTPNLHDDAWFSAIWEQGNPFEWLYSRYSYWTSRIVIEFFLIFITGHQLYWIWRLLDIVMILVIVYSISKLFIKTEIRKNNWILCALFILYPFKDMFSAGWGATTLNYLWPLALSLFSLLSIKKRFQNIKIKWYEYLIYTIILLYGANQEQTAFLLTFIFGSATLYYIWKFKKPDLLLLLQFFISAAQLMLVFICPGNEARKVMSITGSFIDFDMLSFFDKIQIGLSSTLHKVIFSPNLLFTMLVLVLAILTFQSTKDRLYRSISLFPLVVSLGFGLFQKNLVTVFPFGDKIINGISKYGMITIENADLLTTYLPVLLGIAVCVCILLNIYIIFESSQTTWLSIGILILGFASRMSISLSPTIWESGDRTYLFFYIAILIVILIFVQRISLKGKWKEIALYSLLFLSILSYLNNFYFI